MNRVPHLDEIGYILGWLINMTTKILHIQKKHQTQIGDHIYLKNLQDFDYVEGENIESQTVLENPNISLYCLDPQNQRAIFVETPENMDLADTPFFFKAQYKYALRLIAVPYEHCHQLAKSIENSIQQLVLIYYVGRCGSTLLSKIFNQVDTVVSLSEPGIFCDQIIALREPNGSLDDELAEILRSCILLQCKPTTTINPSPYVLKHSAFSIQIGDLIYKLFPDAKVIFLYRNAEDAVSSFINWMKNSPSKNQNIQLNANLYTKFIPLLETYAESIDFTDSDSTDIYTLMWLSIMERYLEFYRKNMEICAVRYEDLVASKQQVVTSLFEYCGFPISEVEKACKAFEKHSQSGSSFSQERSLQINHKTDKILEINHKISRLLIKHPEINTSDFIVPGTLKLSS